jgi:hypothetical protein
MNRGLSASSQGLADPVDGFIEAAVEIDGCVRGPKPFLEFVPRHDFARALDEGYESLKRLLLQFDPDTLLAQFA